MHIGQKIAEILVQRRMTRQELGRLIGISGSAATYLTTRESIDVKTLASISHVLKYDFFEHYPLRTSTAVSSSREENPKESALVSKISELEKTLEATRRDLVMQKQENGYLKRINALLENRPTNNESRTCGTN